MSPDMILQEYEHVFKRLLGRPLNEHEKIAVCDKFQDGATRYDLVEMLVSVVSGDEYFELTREAFAQRLFPKACVVAAKTPLGDEVLVDLRQFHLGFAIATGHFEPPETRFVQRFVKPGHKVVDIGANIGYFATAFGRLVGNSGVVHAFEPVSETYSKLLWAVRRNSLENIVTCHNCALSDVDAYVDMVFDRESTNMGAAHFAADTKESPDLCFQRVMTRRLDDVLGRTPIDFVKIDVEGAEWLVIQGGGNIFQDQKPIVMIEFFASQLENVSKVTPDFLLSRLMDMGFEPYELTGEGHVRKLLDPQAGLREALARTGITNIVLAKVPLI